MAEVIPESLGMLIVDDENVAVAHVAPQNTRCSAEAFSRHTDGGSLDAV